MEKISVEERNEGKSSRTFQNLKGFEETVSGHHQQERTEINLSIMLDIYQLITKDEGRGGRGVMIITEEFKNTVGINCPFLFNSFED
jgi:hypothetical protein